jgi:phospholipid transport system substrate-binding protein
MLLFKSEFGVRIMNYEKHIISRRNLVALFGAAVAIAVSARAPVFAAAAAVERGEGEGGPGVQYLQSISGDLFAAARAGTSSSFLRAINRHADLPTIAEYSLGTYRNSLEDEYDARYRRGVAAFMSRYFSSQVEQYPVERAVITGERPYGEGDTLVKSKLYLGTGAVYNVHWLLSPRGRSFKVRDLRVAGFWLSYFQKRMFERFLASHDGDVTALIAALRA